MRRKNLNLDKYIELEVAWEDSWGNNYYFCPVCRQIYIFDGIMKHIASSEEYVEEHRAIKPFVVPIKRNDLPTKNLNDQAWYKLMRDIQKKQTKRRLIQKSAELSTPFF